MTDEPALDVHLEYFDGCPSWQIAAERLRAALDETGYSSVVIHHTLVSTIEEAQTHRFTGSPTIRINGNDPFAEPDAEPALACRVYTTPDGLEGSPTLSQLKAVLSSLA